MFKLNCLLTLALLASGCATTQIVALPTGGSRADGTVELTYDIGGFQNGKVDYTGAQIQAEQRCAAWGYSGAEKFGGEKRICSAPSGYGCMAWQVTMPYQCTGLSPKQ
jgi:YecR-like lipoprotein